MPITRKLIPLGNSKAITVPKSWLDFLESKHCKIDAVSMEVNGKLTIRPILKVALGSESSK